MNRHSAGFVLLALLAKPAAAHRLDEYLQAALLSLSRDSVHLQLDLTPGVAVFPVILAAIDQNRDGTISDAERSAYAAQVLRDLSLSVDGERMGLRLLSSRFPAIEEMRQGQGIIRLEIAADVPALWPGLNRAAHNRQVRFENRHRMRISSYLVNSEVPRDPALRITAQSRDFSQTFYEVNYLQSGAAPAWSSFWLRTGMPGWIWLALIILLGRMALLWRRRPA